MLLKEFIDKSQISVSEFCRRAKVSRTTFYRSLEGKSILLTSALRISEATEFAVSILELAAPGTDKKTCKQSERKISDSPCP